MRRRLLPGGATFCQSTVPMPSNAAIRDRLPPGSLQLGRFGTASFLGFPYLEQFIE